LLSLIVLRPFAGLSILDAMLPRCPRYQSLDIWRGLACILVVIFHSTFYMSESSRASISDPFSLAVSICERLWIGVPVFFVISGYCISATADSSRRKGHRTLTYFKRRLWRIFPPYLICLALTVALALLGESLRPGLFSDGEHHIEAPAHFDAWQWLGNITLTEAWRPYLIGSDKKWFLAQAWTLGFEEQFYAVTGLLLLVCPRRFFAGASVVTLGVLAFLLVTQDRMSGFFFDGRWFLFAAGILVYYVINYAEHPLLSSLPLLAGLAWSVHSPHALLTQQNNATELSGLVAYSFALALIVFHKFDQRFVRHWTLVPLRACGLMCYSLYLVHWPVCKGTSHILFDLGLKTPRSTMLVTVPVCLMASVATGTVFYLVVERHFLNSPQKISLEKQHRSAAAIEKIGAGCDPTGG
jgi:peptidoglycan/LPS O-acetylase OafA/YrhL